MCLYICLLFFIISADLYLEFVCVCVCVRLCIEACSSVCSCGFLYNAYFKKVCYLFVLCPRQWECIFDWCPFFAILALSDSALCHILDKDVFAQTLFILCDNNMKTNKYSIQLDLKLGWGLTSKSHCGTLSYYLDLMC